MTVLSPESQQAAVVVGCLPVRPGFMLNFDHRDRIPHPLNQGAKKSQLFAELPEGLDNLA